MNRVQSDTTQFPTTRSYLQFVSAREFWDVCSNQSFEYTPNFVERVGARLSSFVIRPADSIFRNIDNPIVITALTIAAFIVVSFVFYPAVVAQVVGYVVPQIVMNILPTIFRFGLFALSEMTVLGVGLRALGRMNNPEIVQAWNEDNLIPVAIGTVVVR